MRKERKHYTAEEKVAILRRHLFDKVPISDLCEEHGLQPTVFQGLPSERWAISVNVAFSASSWSIFFYHRESPIPLRLISEISIRNGGSLG